MTYRTKTMLALGMGIFMLCVCCGGFGVWSTWQVDRSIISGSEEAQTLGAEIANYTLPPGYAEIMGMRIFGSAMVVIASDELSPGSMLIMLTRPPGISDLTQAEMEAQLSTALNQQFALQRLSMTFDHSETREVNGQTAELTYRTGADASGTPYKQMSTLLEGSQGQVFMLAQGTEAEWDQTAIDQLLNSIE